MDDDFIRWASRTLADFAHAHGDGRLSPESERLLRATAAGEDVDPLALAEAAREAGEKQLAAGEALRELAAHLRDDDLNAQRPKHPKE